MTEPIYPTEDRREGDKALVLLLREMLANLKELDSKLTVHIAAEQVELAQAVAGIVIKAFPAGDPEGHRKAHEETMLAIHDRAEFWKKLLFEISKYGVIGLISWLTYTAWAAFLHGPVK